MAKLHVSWTVNTTEGKEVIDFDDFGITEEAFKELTLVEQEELVQNYLDKLDRVYIELDQIYLKGSRE